MIKSYRSYSNQKTNVKNGTTEEKNQVLDRYLIKMRCPNEMSKMEPILL